MNEVKCWSWKLFFPWLILSMYYVKGPESDEINNKSNQILIQQLNVQGESICLWKKPCYMYWCRYSGKNNGSAEFLSKGDYFSEEKKQTFKTIQ